jgi:hypothetical protein
MHQPVMMAGLCEPELSYGNDDMHVDNGNYFFGRLAPYLERLCIRFATPDVSSVPRTMW